MHAGHISHHMFIAAVWLLTGALVACSGSDTGPGSTGDSSPDDTASYDADVTEGEGDATEGDGATSEDAGGDLEACEGLDEGAVCDTDEDLCTREICDAQGVCVDTDETEDCAEKASANPCWTYICNAKNGCIQGNFVPDVSCDDNNPCTYSDLCTTNEFGQESCLGEAIPIDDDNPCTDDACTDGTVTHTPVDGVPCDIVSACGDTGSCESGQCVPDDDCGCVTTQDCQQSDDLCAGSIVCDAGECVVDAATVVVCDPATAPCTDNVCDPATGQCSTTQLADDTACVPEDTTCSATGTCDEGACVADAQCECVSDTDCAPPADLCTGVMICNTDKVCDLDASQAVVCDPATAPCTINICGPTTGLCSAALLDDASVCVPEDTTCSATGTCLSGACEPDTACECETDSDCASPEDLCSGVMICNADKACELDPTQAVICPPGASPCEGSVCSPDTGECNPISFANDTPCTPTDTTCGDEGVCQLGVCESTGACPTVEAVYVLDGLESHVLRTFDEGDTWEQMTSVPAPPPSLISFGRGGDSALYAGIYFNTGDAADAGYDHGNQIFRSLDGAETWEHMGGWYAGSSSPAVCAGSNPNLLFATDTTGAILRSEDGGVSLSTIGSWGVLGANVDCVVAPSGLVMFADAAYCGDVTDDGCAAVWVSTDLGESATLQGNYTPEGLGNKSNVDVDPNGVFWAVGNDKDIYRSDDEGQNWSMAGSVPSLKSIGDIVAADNGALYAGTATSACGGNCDPETSGGEFYVSKDGGVTWGKSASHWTPGGNGGGWMALVTVHVPEP